MTNNKRCRSQIVCNARRKCKVVYSQAPIFSTRLHSWEFVLRTKDDIENLNEEKEISSRGKENPHLSSSVCYYMPIFKSNSLQARKLLNQNNREPFSICKRSKIYHEIQTNLII